MGARTIAFVSNVALPLVLVRRLNQHEFGLYKQVFLIVGSAVITLPVGFTMSAYYFLPREEAKGRIVLNIVLFYLAIATTLAIALVFYPELLGLIFRNTEVVNYGPLIALVSFFWILSAPLETIVIANTETKLATLLIVCAQLSKALLLLLAALSIGSVRAIIYAGAVHGLIQVVVFGWYLTSRFGPFWSDVSWSAMKRQLAYALPLGLAAFLLRAHSDLHNYFVSYKFDAAQYAIYAIGCFNIIFVDIVTDAVGSVMIPRVNYLQTLGERREIIELLARMLRKTAVLFLSLYFFLLVMGREFITFLFTERYVASWPIFAVNLTLIPLALFSLSYDPVVRAYPEIRFFLIRLRTVLLFVLLLALNLLTSRFGLVGAITAVVLLVMAENTITAWKSARILGVKAHDIVLLKDVGKILLAALVAASVTWIVRGIVVPARPFITLSICAIVFAIVFGGMILMLRVLTSEERLALKNGTRKLSLIGNASTLR
jgi:O-antigen/teichoic acid export membrane protein